MAAYQSRLVSSGVLDVVRRWIAVSDFMRDRFIEAGIAPERIITLRHCWQPRLSPIPQSADSHYLFLGRLVPEKGVRVLIDAWAILEKRLGKSCPRLVIAGSGPIEAEIQAASHRMHQVTCVGYTEGKIKDDLLLGCRALIAPSIWWEPLGLIVHEAYDAARPVLAAASGGLTETVIPGHTGFLHTPGDAEALANDVERVEAMSLMQRNEIGQNGREWLIQNANPQDWITRFTQILQDAKNER
jgi:glycosyltransferase involved in cell wall biosynthesis